MIKLKELLSEAQRQDVPDEFSFVWGAHYARPWPFEEPKWAKANHAVLRDKKLAAAWGAPEEWLTGGKDYHAWFKSEGKGFRKATYNKKTTVGDDPRKVEALLMKYADIDALQDKFNVPKNHIWRMAIFISYFPLANG
jgi:hypothetical protein